METLLQILFWALLIAHVVTGVVSLVTGAIALSTVKGGKNHKKSGVVFYYAMIVVALTGIGMSVIRPSMFLLLIGVFTFYMNYMGRRAVKNKELIASRMDIVVVLIGVVNTIFMLWTGNLVVKVFGSISAFLVSAEIWAFLKTARGKKLPHQQWLMHHIGRMIGAYIATTTAFLVVNVKGFQPHWIPWLMPSVIGGILIAYYLTRVSTKRQKLA